jgi:hypothetical protein
MIEKAFVEIDNAGARVVVAYSDNPAQDALNFVTLYCLIQQFKNAPDKYIQNWSTQALGEARLVKMPNQWPLLIKEKK